VLYALAERSDVFVQNFRQGVADRLGLGYATMQEKNPRLIYASATGYGPYGPDSARPAYDQLGLARSGMMLAAGEPGMPPLDIAGGISDQLTGAMLAYGVMTALFARERTGRGQEVNASQLGSMLFLQSLSVSMKLITGTAIPRTARASATNPLWNRYRCADDKWLAVAMLEADRYWADLTRAIGRPELAGDERFAEIHERAAHAVECVAILDDVFATRPRDAWIRILEDDPGDFIYTVVNSVDDLPDDPQVRANDYIVTIDHPQCGRADMVGVPVQLSDTPGSVRAPAPELGQHTEEVLTEVLHWDWDQLNVLRATGVI
jgi:crotonobetainyl-CoA:carnitine CoA-transferase CaiB-like acyl-CoA transferase